MDGIIARCRTVQNPPFVIYLSVALGTANAAVLVEAGLPRTLPLAQIAFAREYLVNIGASGRAVSGSDTGIALASTASGIMAALVILAGWVTQCCLCLML